jgi:uncharacterized protein YcfJ
MRHPDFRLITLTALVIFLQAPPAQAQKSGQSIQIQYGVVVGSTYVKEKSNAAAGALIGGAIGLLVGKGKSTGTKVATTAAGAGLGGLTASKMQGDRSARQYTVATATGQVTIISDQLEIQVDDCVLVENPGTSNANIRRVSATYCHPDSADVIADLSDEMMDEAAECVAAKKELVAADTDAAVDRALRKMSILCDD